MKNFKLLCIIIACANIFAACKKDKSEPTELSKLPAATQTGANTFGCLVNGKAWVAQRNDCRIFCPLSFQVYYDGVYGGALSIEAYKIDVQNNVDELIQFGIDSTNFKINHEISISKKYTYASFKNYKNVNNCSNYQHGIDSTVMHFGTVKLSRYDLSNGIIAGTFNFTITKPGCETITITEGRFDKKL